VLRVLYWVNCEKQSPTEYYDTTFTNTYTRTLYYICLRIIDTYFFLESLNQSPVLIKIMVTPYHAMTDTDVE